MCPWALLNKISGSQGPVQETTSIPTYSRLQRKKKTQTFFLARYCPQVYLCKSHGTPKLGIACPKATFDVGAHVLAANPSLPTRFPQDHREAELTPSVRTHH